MTTVRGMFKLIGGYCSHYDLEAEYLSFWEKTEHQPLQVYVICGECGLHHETSPTSGNYVIKLTEELEWALKLSFSSISHGFDHRERRVEAARFVQSYVEKEKRVTKR